MARADVGVEASRVATFPYLRRSTLDHLAKMIGEDRPFPDRGRACDWMIREVRRRSLVDRDTQVQPLPPARRSKTCIKLARDVTDWLEQLRGPEKRPFKTRDEAAVWCLETATELRLKPTKQEALAAAEAEARQRLEEQLAGLRRR